MLAEAPSRRAGHLARRRRLAEQRWREIAVGHFAPQELAVSRIYRAPKKTPQPASRPGDVSRCIPEPNCVDSAGTRFAACDASIPKQEYSKEYPEAVVPN